MSVASGKSERAYRTIGEAADEVGVAAHVLRFWETKFHQIKPLKRSGGRRFYRPEDIALLLAIKESLHSRGYTIKGVQKLLREQGVDALRQQGGPEPQGFVERMSAVAERLETTKAKLDAALHRAAG